MGRRGTNRIKNKMLYKNCKQHELLQRRAEYKKNKTQFKHVSLQRLGIRH